MSKFFGASLRPVGRYVLLLLSVCGCGPAVRRNLTSVRLPQITYDDLCHLQDYFDQRAAARTQPFRVLNEQSVETSRLEPDERGRMRRVTVGEGTYRVRDRSDRLRLKQLLREEYRRLPEMQILPRDAVVDVHVTWFQSGAMRRLRPDADIEVAINDETFELPYQPCVGEFLFGDSAYAMRRNIVGAERARAHGEIPTQYLHPDAGPDDVEAPDGGEPDAPGALVIPLSERVARAVGVLGSSDSSVGVATPLTDATVQEAGVVDVSPTDARAHHGRRR